MQTLFTIILIIGVSIIIGFINVIIHKLIVNKAVKKFIQPYINDNGYKLKKVEFVGLFKSGDFKRNGFPLRPFMPTGFPMQSTYIYVYLSKEGLNHLIRITAKIDSIFLLVKRVEYSQNLEF